MSNQWSRIGLGVFCLGVLCNPLRAADAAQPTAPIHDPAALAVVIDHYIDAGQVANKATPAPLADDSEFLRRVYLDLAGRIPRNKEVRDFLADKAPDKRVRLVEALLESPQYVNHMTHVYRALLLPQSNDPQVQALSPAMEAWLRKHFLANTPYDEMVRELLTTNVVQNPAMQQQAVPVGGITGVAFFQGNQLKPENLAAATSRLFLGVKLECAQCHDSKFDKWTRKQFWEYAAFFSGIGPQTPDQAADDNADFTQATDAAHRHSIKMPGGDKVLQARFLDGKQPTWKEDVTTRQALAEWMTSPNNPYFAQAAVNRIWAHLFGIGIVDPPDDFRKDNPPSHPELLNALAQAFVDNHYDLKSHDQGHHRQQGLPAHQRHRRFGRRPTAVHAHVGQGADGRAAVRQRGPGDRLRRRRRRRPQRRRQPARRRRARAEFLARFSNSADKRTETTDLDPPGAVADERPHHLRRDEPARKQAESDARLRLRRAVHGRRGRSSTRSTSAPSAGRCGPTRRSAWSSTSRRADPSGDSRKALADVFWALLNSSEFIFNH